MDTKDQIIKDISRNLFSSLWRTVKDFGFENFDKDEMGKLVTEFVESKAEGYTKEDLLTEFGDMEKLLDQYVAFLETKLKVGNSTVH